MLYRIRPKGSKTVDPSMGKRLLNACWLAASLGSFTLELRLLAQALSAIHTLGATQYQGTLIGGIALAWICGAMLGRSLSRHASALTWGIWLLAVSLIWLAIPSLGLSLAIPLTGDAVRLSALTVLAVLLAQLSAAWTSQERPWPRVAEGTIQLSSLGGILFGLVVTWLVPDVASFLGIALLLPLLLVDLWPASRCPLPRPVRHWSIQPAHPVYRNAPHALQVGCDNAPRARSGGLWWWSWLDQRGQLSLVLLASCGKLVLTSVWSVVPTLYAWDLARTHALVILVWLQSGQLCAFLLGALALRSRLSRRLFGTPGHRIAPMLLQPAFVLGWGALLAGAAALAALGNPWLQTPWFLGLAITGFTLSMATWNRMRSRLLSSLTPELGDGQRHLPWILPSTAWGSEDLPAHRVARDKQARRCVSRWETALLMGTVLFTGFLSDQWGIDSVLVLAGGVIVASIGLAVLTSSRSTRLLDAASVLDQQSRSPWEIPAPLREWPAAASSSRSGSSVRSSALYPLKRESESSPHASREPTMTERQLIVTQRPSDEDHSSNFAARSADLPLDGEESGNGRTIH
jgi:hypothetical protein